MSPGSAQLLRQSLLLGRFCAASVWKSFAAAARSLGICHGTGDVPAGLRFSAEVPRYVEASQWHSSQRCERERDGSLLVRRYLPGTTEAKSWVLSFGRHAEVLTLKALRDEVRYGLTAALAPYAGATSLATLASIKRQLGKTKRGLDGVACCIERIHSIPLMFHL